jgi:mannose-6-phosphate isomerase-like protein (cupin superfamily)
MESSCLRSSAPEGILDAAGAPPQSHGRSRTGLHRHNRMDEPFYVVRGTLTVYVEGQLRTLPAGSFVLIPRGTPHVFCRNAARFLRLEPSPC